MFLLLTRVLVWLLLGTIIYALFQRFYPSGTFIGRVALVAILCVIVLSFLNPNEPAVTSLWNLISFPLKPLGASVLLMIFAAQKIKGGGIEKPGGYLLGWALTILLLASTPAVAYFLVRIPLASGVTSQQVIENGQLRVEHFVPSAETLGLTSQVWESYLTQISIFLRGARDNG